MAENDYLEDDGSTPSQRELDASTEGDQIANALRWQGQLMEAKRQVQTKVARGGSKGLGRELLGQIDDLMQSGDADAAAQFGKDYDSFIHTGVGPASQGAAPAQSPAQGPARTAPGSNRPPPPRTAATRQRENQRLLDPKTTTDEIKAIRSRQKAAGEG